MKLNTFFPSFLFFLSSLNLLAQTNCDYKKNVTNEFDGTIIKELNSQRLYDDSSLKSSGELRLSAALSSYGNKKYVHFYCYDTYYYWGQRTCKTKIILLLDNGKKVSFFSVEGKSANYIDVKGKLLENEINLLKKFPINIIRAERLCPDLIGEDKYLDFKIKGKNKYYFIENIECID